MSTSIPTRRGPPYAPASVPADEDFINRSLLDSVNAQGDAEPGLSSSDSETTGAAISAFGSIPNASSVGSPSIPYHISMQAQQQQQQQTSHPDSPSTNNILPSYLQSPPHNADSYSQGIQNSQQLYNSISSLPSPEHDALNSQTKANGFSSAGPFRTSVPFTAFSNGRSRHNTSYRDASSGFATPTFGSAQTDVYIPNSHVPQGQSATSPTYETVHHPGRYDFALPASQSTPSLVPNGQVKNTGFSAMDAYRLGLEPSMPAASQMKQSSALGGPPGLVRDAQMPQQTSVQPGFQAQQLNGLAHQLPHQMQSQAYGTHSSMNGPGPGPSSGAQGSTSAPGPQQGSQQQPAEEISTIFVVGFPDDMSEREFQNMFTFSSGFEAATLKIPNRDYNSSGAAGLRSAALPMHYAGSNDPYNIVTVNQGGVVVDGRDGTTSWPAPQMAFMEDGHFIPSSLPMQPPRKQIIGFAKFRTRQEALEARDILQGRRVDIEKGSVLKAEMAKKNLHTKRGPGMGSMGGGSLLGGAQTMQTETLANALGGSANSGEVFMQREKELGLGPMTIAGLGQRRATIGDGREDVIGMSSFTTRGARERAEEDERERERKRKEKEAQRLRQNSYAFEAFHSVPQQMVRQGANSLLSAENGTVGNTLSERAHTLSAQSSMQSIGSQVDSGPWPNLRDVGTNGSMRKMSAAASSLLPPRPVSDEDDSPTNREAPASPPSDAQSASGSTNPSAPFSPQSTSSMLPSYASFQPYPRASSPPAEGQALAVDTGSMPTSSASSVNGASGFNGDDLARAVGALAVSTEHEGTMSPQLPSPASGSSSGHGRSPGDQNPPINTLYVGNLPSSPSPGGSPPVVLEERLRELFSKRPGYRKLCFRQKSNGPMCFVEFEDVTFATKALNELHGDTLGGLIKGGIRLSYSKNPLGVRTPTSGGSGPSLQQQQANSQQAFYSTNTVDDYRMNRRDTSGMTSPTSAYYYTHSVSSPPPRFAASPPSASFSSPLSSSGMFPRANPQGFSLSSGLPSSFSPFGISPSHSSIPDQPSADSSNDQFTHAFSSANIEASRAG